MKLRKLAIAPIAAAAMAFSIPASAATQSWILNLSGITGEQPGTGNYGTVTLTDNGLLGTTVHVKVELNAQGFVQTGSHTSFSYNLDDAPDSVTGITAGFSIAPPPITNNGFGTFTNGITSCLTCPPGNGFTPVTTLEFDVNDADTISISSFMNLSTNPPGDIRTLFAADIMTNLGNTGAVGVGAPPIPEPETYAMMLVGFGLLGFVARRRKQSLGNLATA